MTYHPKISQNTEILYSKFSQLLKRTGSWSFFLKWMKIGLIFLDRFSMARKWVKKFRTSYMPMFREFDVNLLLLASVQCSHLNDSNHLNDNNLDEAIILITIMFCC